MFQVIGPLFGISLVANIAFGLLWLNARDAVTEERGSCNADKIQTELDAANARLAGQGEAHNREIAGLVELLERERRAVQVERENAELARSRPAKVRTIVKEIKGACMDAVVPDDALNSVYGP